jgi:hypothetical protein
MTHIKEHPSDDPRLHEFAESFGHKIDTRWKTLLAVSEKTGEWLGYLQIIDAPSSVSGWKSEGKETISAIKAMRDFCREIGVVITWCEQKSPLYRFMERFGFQKPGIEVFFTLPNQKKGAK